MFYTVYKTDFTSSSQIWHRDGPELRILSMLTTPHIKETIIQYYRAPSHWLSKPITLTYLTTQPLTRLKAQGIKEQSI